MSNSPILIKSLIFATAAVAISACTWFFTPLKKTTWDPAFGHTWHCDIEASVEQIESIPQEQQYKYQSLDEYKDRVRELAKGLKVIIDKDGKAQLIYHTGITAEMDWQEDKKFDYWLQTESNFGPSIGHGFIRTSNKKAILHYQVDYSETVTTREDLVLHRMD